MGTMFDTDDDPAQQLRGLTVEAVAAYANGRYANDEAARREFPKAHHITIDVLNQGVGDAGDFENGDMRYSEAGSWAKGRIEAGIHRPVVYFEVSSWGAVMESLQAAGVERSQVRIWTAHYTGEPHLCSSKCNRAVTGTADATQWASSQPPSTLPREYAGRNIDVSETSASFFDAK